MRPRTCWHGRDYAMLEQFVSGGINAELSHSLGTLIIKCLQTGVQCRALSRTGGRSPVPCDGICSRTVATTGFVGETALRLGGIPASA